MICRSLDAMLGVWSDFVKKKAIYLFFFICVFFFYILFYSNVLFILVFIGAFSSKIAKLVLFCPKSPNFTANWHFFTKSHQISLEIAILALFHWKLPNLAEYCKIATFLQSAGVSSLLNFVFPLLTILFH